MFGWLKRSRRSEESSSPKDSYGVMSTVPEPSWELPEDPMNISFVLLKGTPTEDAIRQLIIAAGMTLDEDVDDDEETSEDEDTPLTFFASGNGWTYVVSLFPSLIPDKEAEGLAHPFFCDSDEIEGYDAHLIVASMYGISKRPTPTSTAEAVEAITEHSTFVAHLLGLPEAVGVYSGRTCTTFDAGSYRSAVLDDPFPPVFISPLWVNSDGKKMYFYTFGMQDIGYPEVQVIKSLWDDMDPEHLYAYLMDVLAYIINGNPIRAGETLGRTAEEKFTTSWQPWIVEKDVTALQIDLNL